jgi:hypothetical protein
MTAEIWGATRNGPLPSTNGDTFDVLTIPDLGQPHLLTVSLSRQRPASYSSELNADAHAEIQYGVGSASRTVHCDWRGQFTVTASRLSIRGRTNVTRATAYSVDDSEFRFSAMVAPGSSGSSWATYSPTVETVPTTGGGFDALRDIAVPELARRVYLRFVTVSIADFSTAYIEPAQLADGLVMLTREIDGAPFHVENVSEAFLRDGLLVGNASRLTVAVPLSLSPSYVQIQPVFELSL